MYMCECWQASKQVSEQASENVVGWRVLATKEMLPFPFELHAISASQKRIKQYDRRDRPRKKRKLCCIIYVRHSQERNNQSDCMLHAIAHFIGVVLVRKKFQLKRERERERKYTTNHHCYCFA